MKISYLNRAVSLFLSVVMLTFGFGMSAFAQDGSPDIYLPNNIEETEEVIEEEDSYFNNDLYYDQEEEYHEDQVKEDTSSVSMLTFNFLFYMVYKLKFSENENKQEASKTADD